MEWHATPRAIKAGPHFLNQSLIVQTRASTKPLFIIDYGVAFFSGLRVTGSGVNYPGLAKGFLSVPLRSILVMDLQARRGASQLNPPASAESVPSPAASRRQCSFDPSKSVGGSCPGAPSLEGHHFFESWEKGAFQSGGTRFADTQLSPFLLIIRAPFYLDTSDRNTALATYHCTSLRCAAAPPSLLWRGPRTVS